MRADVPVSEGYEIEVDDPKRGMHVGFRPRAGVTTAVVGPNGSGKSTTVQAVAGLFTPPRGLVRCGGETWVDTGAGVDLPPQERRAGLLLQDPGLFPHLDVRDNVAFGIRLRRGTSRARSREVAETWLRAVGGETWASRMPRELSGGQGARVAIARALAIEPSFVLLDEPFAALDVEAAREVRGILTGLLQGRTALLVTHDLLDVAALAHDVVVIDGGRVHEHVSVEDFLRRPRSDFGCRLTDRNRLALPDGTTAWCAPSDVALRSSAESVPVPDVLRFIEPRGLVTRFGGDRAVADLPSGEGPQGMRPGDFVTWHVPRERLDLEAHGERKR